MLNGNTFKFKTNIQTKELFVRNILFLSFIILLMRVVPVYSAEVMLVDSVTSQAVEEAIFSKYFGLTVTSRGKLIVKPGTVFTEGQEAKGTQLPYLLGDPKPIAYPRQAISEGFEGKLILALEILPDGSVGRYQVMKSTGYELLDAEAVKAVTTWKFYPAVNAGKPLTSCIQVPISFELEGE